MGAKSSEISTIALTQSTITGPVESPAPLLLITAPLTPASAPKSAANATISPRRLVHWRAAAAGATTIALMSTTPTACRPTTIAITSSTVIKISSQTMGKPRLAPKSRSKLSSLNSFQKSSMSNSAAPPKLAITMTS